MRSRTNFYTDNFNCDDRKQNVGKCQIAKQISTFWWSRDHTLWRTCGSFSCRNMRLEVPLKGRRTICLDRTPVHVYMMALDCTHAGGRANIPVDPEYSQNVFYSTGGGRIFGCAVLIFPINNWGRISGGHTIHRRCLSTLNLCGVSVRFANRSSS
jgi:hypothetical protein